MPQQDQYSVEDFARMIRKKYPTVYDQMSDQELTDAIVKKYPVYGNQIKPPAAVPSPATATGPRVATSVSPSGKKREGIRPDIEAQEYKRGDQQDPVPTIGPNGVRGTVSTSGPNRGQDFVPFGGAPFQTAKGAEMGISMQSLPDISKFTAAVTEKTPNELKDVMLPRFQPFEAKRYHLDPQMLPINRLLSIQPGRNTAGFAGTVAGGQIFGAIGGAVGPYLGIPAGASRFVASLVGAGLTGATAARLADWIKGTPSPVSVQEDVITSVVQDLLPKLGTQTVPWLIKIGVPSSVIKAIVDKLPYATGFAGEEFGRYYAGFPYGSAIGGALGGFGGAALQGTIRSVIATPEYKALSAGAQRAVLSLLQQRETEIALSILTRKATPPVYHALQPQGRTGPTGEPIGPKGTNTALSAQDEQAFRKFIRDKNVVFDPDNPKPDWDARAWWLQYWKQ